MSVERGTSKVVTKNGMLESRGFTGFFTDIKSNKSVKDNVPDLSERKVERCLGCAVSFIILLKFLTLISFRSSLLLRCFPLLKSFIEHVDPKPLFFLL